MPHSPDDRQPSTSDGQTITWQGRRRKGQIVTLTLSAADYELDGNTIRRRKRPDRSALTSQPMRPQPRR